MISMELKFRNRFPRLETNRLILRQMTKEDAPFIHFLRNDERVNALVSRPRTESVEDAAFFIDQRNQDFFNKTAIYWGLELKTNGFLIGSITLWHLDLEHKSGEIGFDLHPDFHKRGLMSEAVDAVLDFGFNTLGLEEITGVCSPDNEASAGLLVKSGFKPLDRDKLSEIDQEAGLIGFVKRKGGL